MNIAQVDLSTGKTQMIKYEDPEDNQEWLIYLAAKDFSYIVCADIQEVVRIWTRIQEMNLTDFVPHPITWYEFVTKSYDWPNAKGLLISNFANCLKSFAPVPVLAVTWREPVEGSPG